jgi:hypothetical protein
MEFKPIEELNKMTYTQQLEYVLNLCIITLYESIEIAPLDAIPPNNGDVIQEAQAILDMHNNKKK